MNQSYHNDLDLSILCVSLILMLLTKKKYVPPQRFIISKLIIDECRAIADYRTKRVAQISCILVTKILISGDSGHRIG